jgi:hypothetical protein
MENDNLTITRSTDTQIQAALEVVLAAIGMERMSLGDRADHLLMTLRKSLPSTEDPEVELAWHRIHATVDHERLGLDEGREAEFLRTLNQAGLYRIGDQEGPEAA